MLLHGKPLSRGGMNEGKICKLWNEKKVLKSRKIGFHNWARINDFGLGKDKVNIVHIVLRTSARKITISCHSLHFPKSAYSKTFNLSIVHNTSANRKLKYLFPSATTPCGLKGRRKPNQKMAITTYQNIYFLNMTGVLGFSRSKSAREIRFR